MSGEKPKSDAFLEYIYRRAAEMAFNWGSIPRNTDDLRRHIDKADIVIGIVIDSREARGFGVPLIKGANFIRDCISRGVPVKGNMAAVPCRNYEEAAAMQQMFGDSAGGGLQ